jgi:hypothetical protein
MAARLLQLKSSLSSKTSLIVFAMLTRYATRAFQLQSNAFHPRPLSIPSFTFSRLHVHTGRDADIGEMMVGGERYEMIPLPDSMVDTTLFVGNIDEFVHDDDLSQLFQSVSALQSLPACVARKPDMTSMEYGFVSFLTVEEKEVRQMCTI